MNSTLDTIRQGVVLRFHAPYRFKVSLLDAALGRVEAIFSAPSIFKSLVHGGLISYRLELWRDVYRISDVELLATPAAWVSSDILFLHHVLEMAAAFIQEHNRCPAVGKLFMKLYDAAPAESNIAFTRRLFLGKFFALLGVYPDDALAKENISLFQLFSVEQDDLIIDVSRVSELDKKLPQWLMNCITTHPRAHTFTTVEFVRIAL